MTALAIYSLAMAITALGVMLNFRISFLLDQARKAGTPYPHGKVDLIARVFVVACLLLAMWFGLEAEIARRGGG